MFPIPNFWTEPFQHFFTFINFVFVGVGDAVVDVHAPVVRINVPVSSAFYDGIDVVYFPPN